MLDEVLIEHLISLKGGIDMKITAINTNNNISFRENRVNDIKANVAILPLQNPNAGINFQKEFERSTKADAVQSSMLPALAYKFVKTYNILFAPSHKDNADNKDSKQHVEYVA